MKRQLMRNKGKGYRSGHVSYVLLAVMSSFCPFCLLTGFQELPVHAAANQGRRRSHARPRNYHTLTEKQIR